MKEAQLQFTRLNDWIWRKLPNCKEIVKLMTASLDGRLSAKEWIIMKVHLFSCDSCVNFIKQIKLIRNVLVHSDRRIEKISPSANAKLSEDAKARIKESLDLHLDA